MAEYPGKLRIQYRHVPIDAIHPHARSAAIASECANEQGKFEAYHDRLFSAQDSIGKIEWQELAEQVGVPDLDKFTLCIDSRATAEARIKKDSVAAARLGVAGTPNVLVNEWRVEGAPSLEVLRKLIESEIRASESVARK